MMTNLDFVSKLKEIEEKYITHYATGTFGQCATVSTINAKKAQYPKNYNKQAVDTLLMLPDDARLFDCCGLIKGVLWGFPNMIYTSNGVPDVNDQGLYDASKDKTTDFSNIEVGELLWIKGHVGVYIGDGRAIECTNKWTKNVLVSTVANIKSGTNSRKWTAHAKLPYVEYVESASEPIKKETKHAIVNTKSDPLYCRKTPRGQIISSFIKGTKLTIVDDSGDWWLVQGLDYKNQTISGYCYSEFLRRV